MGKYAEAVSRKQNDDFFIGYTKAKKAIIGPGASVFDNNANRLIRALMPALIELRDKGEIQLTPSDMLHYIAPLNLVGLTRRDDLSIETQDKLQSFLKSVGWKPEIADPSRWGDFDRTYRYTASSFIDLLSLMSVGYNLFLSAAEPEPERDVERDKAVAQWDQDKGDVIDRIHHALDSVLFLVHENRFPEEIFDQITIALSAVDSCIRVNGYPSYKPGAVETAEFAYFSKALGSVTRALPVARAFQAEHAGINNDVIYHMEGAQHLLLSIVDRVKAVCGATVDQRAPCVL